MKSKRFSYNVSTNAMSEMKLFLFVLQSENNAIHDTRNSKWARVKCEIHLNIDENVHSKIENMMIWKFMCEL